MLKKFFCFDSIILFCRSGLIRILAFAIVINFCQGQVQEEELLVQLTHYSLSDPQYQFFPYTFLAINVTEPYALALFEHWKKNKIIFYKDKNLSEPYSFEQMKKDVYFMRHILKKNYRQTASLPYQLQLWAYEKWLFQQDSLIRRSIKVCFWEIKDLARPEVSGIRLYFHPFNVFISRGWKSNVWCNTTATFPTSFIEILANQLYNFIPSEVELNQIVALQKQAFIYHQNHNPNLKKDKEIEKDILIQIPESLNSENHIANLAPTCSLQIEQNYQLFRSVVPLLFKNILEGKIPLRYFDKKGTTIPLQEIYAEIEQHPLAVAKITKQNLQSVDFSFGVKKIEVFGKIRKVNFEHQHVEKVYFIPEKVAFTWYNPSAVMPYTSLGYCKIEEIKRKGGISAQQFLKWLKEGNYYSFVCKVNDYGVKSLRIAYILENYIKTGEWDKILPAALLE
ncbi:MAG: hypothetical protein RML72_07765 [Bacteroidia bacterium]|nr:hypothetical protein [Bacteroidia bacterium]MDW8158755.1 hypothetical protein [Bacteroidia bacterium]